MSFERKSVTTCGNNKVETNFFKNFSRIFKNVSITVSKHCIQLSFGVKNLVCFIYFKELLEIDARLIQIEQVLQIGAKLLQIGAAPVVTNRGSSSYYKLGQNYYKSGQVLQIIIFHLISPLL